MGLEEAPQGPSLHVQGGGDIRPERTSGLVGSISDPLNGELTVYVLRHQIWVMSCAKWLQSRWIEGARMEFSGSGAPKFQILDPTFFRVFRRRLLPVSSRTWDLDDLWLRSHRDREDT